MDCAPSFWSFLSTSPLRGTTSFRELYGVLGDISIHVPLAGDDRRISMAANCPLLFLSTSPLRGTTAKRTSAALREPFLSTSPLRGTTTEPAEGRRAPAISIHVPLAGDDFHDFGQRDNHPNFYPRPPCGGRPGSILDVYGGEYISIHVPLAGDDCILSGVPMSIIRISIHVPLAGDDPPHHHAPCDMRISIHVPLAGDDGDMEEFRAIVKNFYPRPPCGGRPLPHLFAALVGAFLSTSPLRGTTLRRHHRAWRGGYFYPRPPCGGRRTQRGLFHPCSGISIHVPLAGDDGDDPASDWDGNISIHVPLAGDDRGHGLCDYCSERISIHVPLAGDDPVSSALR